MFHPHLALTATTPANLHRHRQKYVKRPSLILAPKRRASPLRHGLTVGAATAVSIAVIEFGLLSAIGLFAAKFRVFNGILLMIAIVLGVFAGIRSGIIQCNPDLISRGRCGDCGRELGPGEASCPSCRPGSTSAGA